MNKRRVSFDSCSILHFLTENPLWYKPLRAIYDDAFAGNLIIVVSEVSVAEVNRLDLQGGKPLTPVQSAQLISNFFRHSFIERRGLTSRESEFASTLSKLHDLGTCDALIAATAVYAGADTLYTTDGCSKRRKPGKLLDVGQVITPCGMKMQVEPPDQTVYKAILARAAKPTA
jgi:predicted nucleic acid-binding protein